MRFRLVLPLLAIAPLVQADRLITIPTARKLTDGTFRLESQRDFGAGRNGTDFLAAGLGPSWEGELRLIRNERRDNQLTGDITYNLISPISGIAPGFAFGAVDVVDRTRVGTRAFALVTFRNEFGDGNVPFDVTTGFFLGRRSSPFVGLSVPVYFWLRGMVEHDGIDGRAALEAQPLRGLRLRVIAREGAISGSIGFSAGF